MGTTAPKTYYSNTPGSCYIDKAGERHTFLGGQLTTSDPEIQADLDKQIANGNNMIRVAKLATPDAATIQVKASINAAAEAALKAATAAAAPQ